MLANQSDSKNFKQQIILFGGAFDPIHLGHQQITENLLKQNIASKVWYVPTGTHDFAKKMTNAKHRLAMLKLILIHNTRVEICELEREGISHTFDTLEQLSNLYRNKEFSWVIGSDNLAQFHLWHNWQQALKKYKFYVYPRKNFVMQPLYDGMIALKNMPEVAISSTNIRQKLEQKNSINGLVDEKIEAYILAKSLYGVR